jgi:Zn-dependent protease
VLKIGLSGPGALLWAALYLLLTPRELASLLLAVAAHEAGHIAALGLLDAGVDALCLTGTGLCLAPRRALSPGGEALAALAGPAAGAVWAVAAHALGLELSCAISLVLTVYNLLPLSFLDGGRALAAVLGRERQRKVDITFCVLACAAGLWFALHGFGAGAALAAGGFSILAWRETCAKPPLGVQ